MTGYTIRRMTGETWKLHKGELLGLVDEVSEAYGDKFNWSKVNVTKLADEKLLWFCFKGSELVGFMLASLGTSIFDDSLIILKQHLLVARPQTRAAYLLLKEFIDFGKANANHVVTCIGSETNIKPESLERLGFNKLETLYRMETSK